jgi:hypothetical protein
MKQTLLTLFALIACMAHARANDQEVSNLGDDSALTPGQLRYALKQCQDNGGGTITFKVSGTINVLQGGFIINQPVTIDATSNSIALAGGGTTGASGTRGPVFYLQSGAGLTLKNLTITNFYSSTGDGGAINNGVSTAAITINHCKFFNNQTSTSYSGGAIYCLGPLTITDTEFGGNKGGGGGAIYPRFGNAIVSITGCSFHDNATTSTSGGNGGAILIWDGAKVTVNHSVFQNNQALSGVGYGEQGGGAIFVTSNSSATVTDSTLSGNLAWYGGGGGGIYVQSGSSLIASTSTFDSNGSSFGGAIYNKGTTTLTNATLSGNTAPGNSVTNTGHGGGIFNYGSLTLTNVTLSGNVARWDDHPELPQIGGIQNNGGTVTLTNTGIAQGAAGSNCSEPLHGVGNLSDDGSCGFTYDSVMRDKINLLLGPLANNGGRTETNLPQPASPAINNGTATNAPSTDQRGLPRPQPVGGRYDVGAVELQPSDNATPTPTPTPTATPPSQLLNLSTRKEVGTGDNVLIGGFIVVGTEDKKVLLRGLGPSLPVAGALGDPTLELHASDTTLLAFDDNWRDKQPDEINATGIPPSNELESAIVATLTAKPGSQGGAGYTGVLAGSGGGTGIGLLEIYDLNSAANSKLANISTRGFVGTGDDLLIGGFIPGPSDRAPLKVLVRALGPSLTAQGVNSALQDPLLELHDANGTLVTNDNWRDASNASEIQATLPPPDDRESAIITTLAPSNAGYTAVVRGAGGATGVALVEVYALQ